MGFFSFSRLRQILEMVNEPYINNVHNSDMSWQSFIDYGVCYINLQESKKKIFLPFINLYPEKNGRMCPWDMDSPDTPAFYSSIQSSKLDFRIYWPENLFIQILLKKFGKSHWSGSIHWPWATGPLLKSMTEYTSRHHFTMGKVVKSEI